MRHEQSGTPAVCGTLQTEAHTPCIVCSGSQWRPHFMVLEQCGQCGFIRADLRWSDEQIEALYSAKYFQGEEYADYLVEKTSHRRNFARRYREITQISGPLTSVFEVGCAYGFWLECMAAKGIRCAGIDVCEEAVAYASKELGQQATAGDFLELAIEPGQYEAFCMWDTIEHLPRPDLFVERIVSLLPAKGWFFATTGDIGSRMARYRGPRWRMIHPPTHLQYFSGETLSRLLASRGLRVRAVRSVPVYRNLRSVLANLQVLGGPAPRTAARLADRLIPRPLQERLGAWLDLGDIMLVCAQKI